VAAFAAELWRAGAEAVGTTVNVGNLAIAKNPTTSGC